MKQCAAVFLVLGIILGNPWMGVVVPQEGAKAPAAGTVLQKNPGSTLTTTVASPATPPQPAPAQVKENQAPPQSSQPAAVPPGAGATDQAAVDELKARFRKLVDEEMKKFGALDDKLPAADTGAGAAVKKQVQPGLQGSGAAKAPAAATGKAETEKVEAGTVAEVVPPAAQEAPPAIPADNGVVAEDVGEEEDQAVEPAEEEKPAEQAGVPPPEPVSAPMRVVGIFPSLAMHMIRVGEETGKLDEMLIRVADTYDEEVQNTTKRFISALEPVLILVMALLVGFIVLSLIWAILGINDIAF